LLLLVVSNAKRLAAPAPLVGLLCALVALVPSAAAAQGSRPVIRKVTPLQALPGDVVRLTGRGLRANMVVSFPRRSRARGSRARVTAVLRRRGTRFQVTVPQLAGSGKITVAAAGGARSRGAGPLRILRPAPTARPDPTPSGDGSAFDGNVMWLWEIPNSERGDVNAIADRAKRTGVGTIIIKATDAGVPFQGQFTSSFVAALKAQGLRVCGYSYVYGNVPSAEAAMGGYVARQGADCLVIDAEGQYEGKYAAATTYIRELRQQIGDGFPVALAPFPYVDFHAAFPYSVFLGPGGAAYNLPQMYWRDIGTSVDEVYRHTFQWSRIYERAIFPIGQLYQDPPTDQIVRFRQLARAYGARGVSWWVWQHANEREWAAVGSALPDLTGFAAPSEWPALRRGSKGDPVVWLQMHLLAAGQSVTVNGSFDAATDTALRAVQSGAGLPASGATDAATWQRVLEVKPTVVDWTAQGRPAAYAADGRKKASAPSSALVAPRRNEIPSAG